MATMTKPNANSDITTGANAPMRLIFRRDIGPSTFYKATIRRKSINPAKIQAETLAAQCRSAFTAASAPFWLIVSKRGLSASVGTKGRHSRHYASKKKKPLAGLLDGNSEGEGLGGEHPVQSRNPHRRPKFLVSNAAPLLSPLPQSPGNYRAHAR
jgi:hypothetical protein